jgi:hypothetical protein
MTPRPDFPSASSSSGESKNTPTFARDGLRVAYWLAGLFVATVAFWKLRIIDAATKSQITLGSFDIYIEHYPMTKFGFERLFSGEIPLWNPYQLTGTPFLPVTHVGLFYPGNFIYGFLDTGIAIEVSFVLHLFFAGAGVWMLLRTLEFSGRAGFVAALTFMWSGWMIFYSNQASLISGMAWLPFMIWMVELTLRGNQRAALGVVAAVTLQLFNGATEFFVHSMYVAGAYTLVRLVEIGLGGSWRTVFLRGGLLLGCVVAGVLLAMPQLLPSMALAAESGRGGAGLTFEQAIVWGTIPPHAFLVDAVMARNMVTVGVLPFAGLALGIGTRRRPLFLLFLVLATLALFLVFGGKTFWLYYHTPLGDLFRRPHKFLHIYAFAQSIMAAFAVLALEQRLDMPRAQLAKSPLFPACLASLAVGALWARANDLFPMHLWFLIAGLVLFALLSTRRLRVATLIALIALQGVNLFFGAKQDFVRPAAARERFHEFDDVLDRLEKLAGDQRVCVIPNVRLLPGLMQKMGTVHELRMLGDYSQLASKRAADYINRATPPPNGDELRPFAARCFPTPSSDWRLLDLTSTRFYVVYPDTPIGKFFGQQAKHSKATGVRQVARNLPKVKVYERARALPRAFYVEGARSAATREEVLDILQSDDFRPNFEVVLEGAPEWIAEAGRQKIDRNDVEIVEDLRERVRIQVDAPAAGFVVLTDAYHPDWRASLDGESAPLLIANALFRAVPVPAGRSEIEMVYRSTPFERGLWISGATALALAVICVVRRRQIISRR